MSRRFTQARSAIALAMTVVSAATFAADLHGPMSSSRPAQAADVSASAGAAKPDFNVEKLFANSCGWCHSGAGRVAGKGPQLMSTTLTDAQIIYRVKNGKTAAMPAFGTAFNEEQLALIVKYIRDLKPDGSTQ